MSMKWTGRRLVDNPLVDDGSRFVIDMEGLEQAARDASMIFLCNPMNPTGRVLERNELEQIAAIANEHDLTIVADEIHADLLYPGGRHIPMETIPGAAERTVTLTSATKGFNIPGLRTALAHFGTAELKARFEARTPEHLLGGPGRMGIAATIAAWRDTEQWLRDVMEYVDVNRGRVASGRRRLKAAVKDFANDSASGRPGGRGRRRGHSPGRRRPGVRHTPREQRAGRDPGADRARLRCQRPGRRERGRGRHRVRPQARPFDRVDRLHQDLGAAIQPCRRAHPGDWE